MTAHETEQQAANKDAKKTVGTVAAKIMKLLEELPENERGRVLETVNTLYGA